MSETEALQIDWISLADHRAAISRLLQRSVERIGLTEVAHQLGEDPSTVSNQLARAGNRRPSADLFAVCWLLDPQFRRDLAALKGEVLSRPPDLSPEQALREIAVKAQAEWGKCAAQDVAALLARTKMGGQP